MVDTGLHALVDGGHDDRGEIGGIGGGANLVEDDSQFGLLLAETDHRLHEVVAIDAVEPCRADNHRVGAEFLHAELAGQFGAAIDAVGSRGIGLDIRGMVGAVEHIVGRHLDDAAPTLGHSGGQIGRSQGVEGGAEFLVALCLVDGGIGGTVHDAVDGIALHEIVNGQLVGDVQFGHVGIEITVLRVLFLEQLHLVAQLAVAACNQNIHDGKKIMRCKKRSIKIPADSPCPSCNSR